MIFFIASTAIQLSQHQLLIYFIEWVGKWNIIPLCDSYTVIRWQKSCKMVQGRKEEERCDASLEYPSPGSYCPYHKVKRLKISENLSLKSLPMLSKDNTNYKGHYNYYSPLFVWWNLEALNQIGRPTVLGTVQVHSWAIFATKSIPTSWARL